VAQYAVEKVLELGGKPVTLSDSNGYICDPQGINAEKLAFVKNLKNNLRGRIREYVTQYPEAQYFKAETPWKVKCDIAMPCATQNEIEAGDARILVNNGCFCVSEGANMPSTPEAIRIFQQHKVLFAPGKAANAGGVAVSGLEIAQNSMRIQWTLKEVDEKLQHIMKSIHATCEKYGTEKDGYINYVKGANIGGFIKVANAMIDQGAV
jgi:glutamate dehydrogenase (NADP+)